jgi:hypothetical protein
MPRNFLLRSNCSIRSTAGAPFKPSEPESLGATATLTWFGFLKRRNVSVFQCLITSSHPTTFIFSLKTPAQTLSRIVCN